MLIMPYFNFRNDIPGSLTFVLFMTHMRFLDTRTTNIGLDIAHVLTTRNTLV